MKTQKTPPALAFLRDDTGSYLVEVAAILLPFTMLLFGIFALSMALASYGSATYAVAAGARFASVHSLASLSPAASTDVATVVQPMLFMPNTSSPILTTSYSGTGNAIGDIVCVKLTWSQIVKAPGYNKTFSLQAQAYRVITR